MRQLFTQLPCANMTQITIKNPFAMTHELEAIKERNQMTDSLVLGSILDASFQSDNTELIKAKYSVSKTLTKEQEHLDSLNKESLFWRLRSWLERKKSNARIEVLTSDDNLLERGVEDARKRHNGRNRNAAQIELDKRKHKKEIFDRAVFLLEKISKAKPALDRAQQNYSCEELGFSWAEMSMGNFSDADKLTALETDAKSFITFIEHILPNIVNQKNLRQMARSILSDLNDIEFQGASENIELARFVANTKASISPLLSTLPTLGTPSTHSSLHDLLKHATDPQFFKSPESWLVLWTAIKATELFNNKASGNRSGEDQLAAMWTNAWETQMQAWNKSVLPGLGLAKESIHVARAHFQNMKPETLTGSDVLFLLVVNIDGKRYCRMVFIQFKPGDTLDEPINIWRNGIRQFESMLKVHHPEQGSSALYGQLSRVNDDLAATPAVDVIKAQQHISRGRKGAFPTSEWSAGDCKVDWMKVGESLPSLLTAALCSDSVGAFSNADTAFDWVIEQVKGEGVYIPSYVLMQTVGENAISLETDFKKNMSRLSEALGITYEYVKARAVGREMVNGR